MEVNAFTHSLEEKLARDLRAACDGIPIGCDISQSDDFHGVTSALEFYLPAVLREVYTLWKHESLDGVFYELAIKTAPRQAEIAGLCILISDQTLTPYHVQLRVASNIDELDWLDCCVGELRGDVVVRIAYNSYFSRGGVQSVADRLPSIQWQFHAGFGNATDNAK